MNRFQLLLAGLALTGLANAQDFTWRDVVQEVTIRPDGAVLVTDTRTLTTGDDFGEAFLCLTPGPGRTVTLLGGGALSPGPAARALTQPCENGSGGTELVVRQAERTDERRVFFRYRLDGSLDVYGDVVQWYWTVLEGEHPPVEGYRLTVTAPGPSAAPYDAFVHRLGNPERPQVALSDDRSRLSVRYDAVPENTGVEVRYLMPPDLFTVTGRGARLETLLQDEARVAGLERLEAERQAERDRLRQLPWWAAPVPVVVALLGWRTLRAARRRREREGEGPRYRFEPPTAWPPAAVTALSSRLGSGGGQAAFFATVIDLARRGYGSFEPQGRTFSLRFTDRDEADLLPLERAVLAYLKLAAAERGDPERLEFAELRRYSERNLRGFLNVWSKEVRGWVAAQLGGPRLEPGSVRETGVLFVLALLGAAAFAVGGALTLGWPRAVLLAGAALCGGLGVMVLSAVPAWREAVAPDALGWAAFLRALSDPAGAPDGFFRLWEAHYPYAAALRVSELFLRNLRRTARGRTGVLPYTPLWLGDNPQTLGEATSSLSALSSALSSAGASASAGGSSAGGGGGGGGGSSGGR